MVGGPSVDLRIHASGKNNLTTFKGVSCLLFIPTGVNVGPNLLEKKRFLLVIQTLSVRAPVGTTKFVTPQSQDAKTMSHSQDAVVCGSLKLFS